MIALALPPGGWARAAPARSRPFGASAPLAVAHRAGTVTDSGPELTLEVAAAGEPPAAFWAGTVGVAGSSPPPPSRTTAATAATAASAPPAASTRPRRPVAGSGWTLGLFGDVGGAVRARSLGRSGRGSNVTNSSSAVPAEGAGSAGASAGPEAPLPVASGGGVTTAGSSGRGG